MPRKSRHTTCCTYAQHKQQFGKTWKKGAHMVIHLSNLHSAPIDYWGWQRKSLCNTLNPEVFFHPEGERGASRRRRVEQAKAICSQCPVIQECREYALNNHEPYGVWGGLCEEERADILRARAYSTKRTAKHAKLV